MNRTWPETIVQETQKVNCLGKLSQHMVPRSDSEHLRYITTCLYKEHDT